MASLLHYTMGKQVAVIDCDFPQLSISEVRKHEEHLINTNEYWKGQAVSQFERTSQPFYRVVSSNVVDALVEAEVMKEDNESLDYIFFDVPGTLTQKSMLNLFASMDYIFAPLMADLVNLKSSLNFILLLQENIIQDKALDINLKEMYAFWNQVDNREKTTLYEDYTKVLKEGGVPVMDTSIPSLARFHKNIAASNKIDTVFRSTHFPPHRTMLRGSNIPEFTIEFLSLTQK
jgi:cellulose biosynthesis protein BcsQ